MFTMASFDYNCQNPPVFYFLIFFYFLFYIIIIEEQLLFFALHWDKKSEFLIKKDHKCVQQP